jgi:hypothetical protein
VERSFLNTADDEPGADIEAEGIRRAGLVPATPPTVLQCSEHGVVVHIDLDRVFPVEPTAKVVNLSRGLACQTRSTSVAADLSTLTRKVQRVVRAAVDAAVIEVADFATSAGEQQTQPGFGG